MRDELKKYSRYYIVLLVLVVAAFVLRVWRVDQLLGFYYDQGRDALVITKILEGDLTLIGPTTGIEGIFLGPFYHYFLLPGYFLGDGNPIIASVWQSLFTTLSLLVIFFILRYYFSLRAGLIAAFLFTFAFFQILSDRWLSNPAPATFFGALVLVCLSLGFEKPRLYLPLAALLLGILLQLEASSSFFLLILSSLLVLIYKKKFPLKSIFVALATFLSTLIPQVIFEIRNNFLLTKNLISFIGNDETGGIFQWPTQAVLIERLNLFANVFMEKLIVNFNDTYLPLFIIFLLASLYLCHKYWSKPIIKVCAFWFFGLLLIFLFYQGNYGRIYTYYFNPVIPIFFTWIAVILDLFWQKRVWRAFVVVGLVLFLVNQIELTKNYLSSGVDGPTTVALGNQTQAVKYVLEDSGNEDFNVDTYVPPVIPYAYDYLFSYYGKGVRKIPSLVLEKNLYTIHEVDTQMPEREQRWLERQKGIGKILKQVRFGGVTVERRERYE